MTVAVIGAGLAGLRTCEALRRRGYDGRVVLVGAEPHAPYDRPPLSKEVLRGDREPGTVTLRTADELSANGIELMCGRRATALHVNERQVVLDDGTSVDFDDVVIATGATPRALSGVAGVSVHVLRTVDDAVTLRDVLVAGAHVVVVGAGFIGLEVAASARTRGCHVVVVDVLPGPLGRAIDPAVGQAISSLHAEHDVDVRCGVGVETVESDGRRQVVRLSDGSHAHADVVVAGVGVTPVTDWLDGSGLTVDNGVVCDSSLSAAPGVWAIGDVARWVAPALGSHVRVEHWANATEQPDLVARNIVAGEHEPFDEVPYFWSDQYDAKLQCLGFAGRGDELRVVRGSLGEPKFVALVRRGDRLGGVIGLRSPGQVMRLKPLLASRASWQDALDATSS